MTFASGGQRSIQLSYGCVVQRVAGFRYAFLMRVGNTSNVERRNDTDARGWLQLIYTETCNFSAFDYFLSPTFCR